MARSHPLMVAAAATLSVLMLSAPVAAQTASPDSSATPGTSKEQGKEARKEARMQRNTELNRLEKNGYNPAAGTDPHYPDDIQNAEKKSATPSGGGQ